MLRRDRGDVEALGTQTLYQCRATTANRGAFRNREVRKDDEHAHRSSLWAGMPRWGRALGGGKPGEARTASSRRIAGTVGMAYSGRFASLAVSLATVPLLARTLGSDGFGVYSAALAYVAIFSSLTEFGLTNAATMRMAADPERESDWLGALASLRTIASFAVLVVCAASIPLVFAAPEARLTALVLTGTIVFTGAQALMSVFQARLRGAIPLAITLLQSALWLTAVVCLALLDGGPVLFAVGYTAVSAVIALVQVVTTRRIMRAAWRGVWARWMALLRMAVPLGLAGVFIAVYFQVSSVLLLELGGAEEAGIYGAAYRFLVPLLFLPQAVAGVFLPLASSLRDSDPAGLQRLVQQSADFIAIVSLPWIAIAVALAVPLVDLVFGPGFERTAGVLPILMIAYAFIGYGTLAGFLAPVLGLQWRLTAFAATGALANVGLNIVLIPRYGAVGSAWATVATEALTMSLLLATCLRALGLRLRLGRTGATVLAAGLMATTMYVVRPVGLIPALALGGLVYVGGLLVLKAVRLDELRALRAR
jgi:O-antigen/teichoic acid export membrane protein